MTTTLTTPVTGYQITSVLAGLAASPNIADQIDYTTGIYRFVGCLNRLTQNGAAPASTPIINRAAAEALDPATYGTPYPGNITGILKARDTAKSLFALLSGE